MLASIIIPVWNNLEFTTQCLEAVRVFTPEQHEVVIVDNGSTDGTHAWLLEYAKNNPGVTIVRNETNLGFPVAMNQGILAAKGDYLVALNNDVVVSRNWLSGLLECAASAPDVGFVGPRTNNISGSQMELDTSDGYKTIGGFVGYADRYRVKNRRKYTPCWRITGFCMLMPRRVLDRVGLFDEQFSPGNFEDDDICLRACVAGYRNMICGDVFVHHHGSRTCSKLDFSAVLLENRKRFDEKWSALTPQGISAVMIVKNEATNIGPCLSCIYPHVNEIVLVDTGSTDDTKAIARDMGDKVKVYDFEWCDDFSAARNFANSKATQPWLFTLDADELVSGWESLRLRFYQAHRVITRNYTYDTLYAGCTENKGEHPAFERGYRWFPSGKIRLWPNDQRIQFHYPVHEVVDESVYHLGMEVLVASPLITHHYGYIADNHAERRGEFYFKLLQKQLDSGVNPERTLEQMATQAQGLRRFGEARRRWNDLLRLNPKRAGAHYNIGHCWAEEGQWKKALKSTNRALRLEPENKDFLMNLAVCQARLDRLDDAEKTCKMIIAKHPDYPLPKGLLNAIKIHRGER